MNLKEYPNAAQAKKVIVERLTPASLSQRERDEKISRMGIPAEKPRKSIVTTLGCKKLLNVSFHVLSLFSL